MRYLLTTLLVLVAFSCTRVKSPKKVQRNTYVLFETDSIQHTMAGAYATVIEYDTNRVVDDKVQRYRDTLYWVLWAVPIRDSLKQPIKTKAGVDSTIATWLGLKRGAVLLDLGLPKMQQ